MMLSDATIREYIAAGRIIILPEFSDNNIRPVGIRLHLGSEIILLLPQVVDPESNNEIVYEQRVILDSGYILRSGEFILGSTYEKFQVPRNVVCHIDGRSTIARLGLAIHCTSGVVDGNFDEPRTVVLEIKNNGPLDIILKPKMAIAMLTFSELSAPVLQNSQIQYRGQNSVAPPNLQIQKR